MTATDTRQFMALMAIAQHHGRPSTPTDQAHVESFFSHLKGDSPHLTSIQDAGALDAELARIRGEYNTVRLHAAIGYVTPDDEHQRRGPEIRRARIAGLRRARAERIRQKHEAVAMSFAGVHPLVLQRDGACLREAVARRPWMAGGMGTECAWINRRGEGDESALHRKT